MYSSSSSKISRGVSASAGILGVAADDASSSTAMSTVMLGGVGGVLAAASLKRRAPACAAGSGCALRKRGSALQCAQGRQG